MILTPIKIKLAQKKLLPIFYILFVIAEIVFVWWLPWFPTQDGPSHVYNLAILKDLRNGGLTWGKWFEQHLTLSPNLGFHLCTYPLLAFASPLAAERIFISLYIILFSTAIPLSLRLINIPLFPWSFLVVPAIWSYSLAMGFYSYVIALPFLAVAMALCVTMRKTGIVARCIVSTTVSIILFVCHLIPFCCFALFVLISVLFDDTCNLRKRILTAGILLTPSGAALAWHLLLSANSPRLSALDLISRLPALITDIATASTIYFSPLQVISGSTLSALLFVLIKDSRASESGDYIHKVFGLFALCIAIIALVSPPSPLGGGIFNQRLPTVMLIALVTFFSSNSGRYNRVLRLAVVPVAAIIFIVNVFSFSRMSGLVEKFMSARNIPIRAGAVLMPYRDLGLPGSRVDVLAHAVSHYALIHRLVNAGNYEMQLPYFPIQYKAGMKKSLPSADQVLYGKELINFERFALVEYLIVWDTIITKSTEEKFRKIWQDNRLEVWEKRI